MTAISKTSSRAARLLLIGCSSLALSVPAAANEVIFSSTGAQLQAGQRTTQSVGVTQIALTGGGTVSIVDAAEYTINADGSIDLYKGSITVSGSDAGEVVVRMPEGLEGRVGGNGSSASFSVAEDGECSGHTLGGSASVGQTGRGMRRFAEGMMWNAAPGRAPRRTIANPAVAQPDRGDMGQPQASEVAAIGGDAGPVAAAVNGIPVTLGDGLAAAGASSDIIAAGRRVEAAVANPSLETFPSGDFALLIAAAAQLEGAYGGQPFNAAQADVIRAYLRFLATGGARADFLSAYSGFVLDYLDLIRAGGVPSGFASGAATAADVDAYLAFIGRTGAIADLATRDRALADAYLAFIASGGDRDLFAASFTNLTSAYFAFLRAGGVPGDFTGASQDALAQSIAFLRQSGLDQQLSEADRALISAFLENGGIAFASQFETALDAYFAYLASGRLPSEYDALDQATLRAYLETLANTGLLEAVLDDQAAFYADYLTFLRAGGDVDAFAGLPANIFAGYAVQLDAYFAFLAAGNLPSQFAAADIAQLQSFILQLQAAGALDRFLGANQAAFFASFGQFVADGGAFDNFAGLNANIFAGYALDLQAYFEFLSNGGIPSAYTVLSQETIAAYIAALEAAGATDRFLLDLTDFYQAYFQFVLGGGNPDNFAGLPVPPDFPAFADALNAYAAFLAANGLPSDYSDEDIARLQAFFAAVLQSGQVDSLLGANGDLLTAYFAFLEAGGQIDEFAGLPIYLDYVAALNAYAAFLSGGGLPSDYAALDLSILRAYLDALAALPGGLAGFDALADNAALISAYFAFVGAGGDIDGFTGLPIYADYIAALNAYFEFLANGGLPSEYTALDLAILEAYLAALAALQGGLAGFADLNNFFIDYYEFLLGGGDPDQFAGLPGNGGGGNGGNPDVPPQLAGYTGGFDAVEPLIGFVLGGGFNGGLLSGGEGLGFKAGNLVLDDDGGLQSYVRLPSTGGMRTKGSTEVVDIFGNSDALIGRWTNGTISIPNTFTFNENQGLHYLLTRPVDTDFALPASGRIDYYQIAATRPTIADGSVAPGTFAAQMAILLGTEAKLALEGTITMPTGPDPYVFSFSTEGGIADPSQSTNVIGLTSLGTFSAFVAATDNGGTCGSIDSCGLSLTAGFAGDVNTVGLTYRAVREGFGQNLAGAAIFEAGPERTFDGNGGGNGGDTGTGAAFDFAYQGGYAPAGPGLFARGVYPRTNQFGLNLDVLRNNQTATNRPASLAVDIEPSGALSRITARTTGENVYTRGTTTNFDVYGDASLLIGRWSDGTFSFNVSETESTIGPNQGFHYLLTSGWDSAPDFPTGRVTYDLLAATSPTLIDGALAPGAFDAELAIIFGATPRIVIDGSIIFTGATGFIYSFATEGGIGGDGTPFSISSPGGPSNLFSGGYFSFQAPGTTNDGRAGTFFAEGQIVDPQASRLGFVYEAPISDSSGQNANTIHGAAIYGASENGGGSTTAVGGVDQFDTSVLVTAAISYGEEGFTRTSRTNQADVSPEGVLNSIGSFGRGNATGDQIIGDQYAIIGRWIDGDVTFPTGNGSYTTTGDDASHWAIVSVVDQEFGLTGQITYDLLGATTPTYSDGRTAPGTFDGSLSINWLSSSQIALNLAAEVTMPDAVYTWAFQSPNFLPRLQGVFESNASINGTPCANNSCEAAVSYQFGGANLGERFAMNYNLSLFAEGIDIGGSALFGAPGTFDPASYPGTATGVASSQNLAAIAPSAAALAGSDWSRWTGAPGAVPSAVGPIGANASFDPVAQLRQTVASADGRPAPQAQRDWAIDQVERLMGGTISFGGATQTER